MRPPSPSFRLVFALCAAEILSMIGAFTFPALIPFFIADWRLTNAEAGWIGGIYFAGYTIAVPLLTSLTDRMDSRRVYAGGAALAAVAALGFAFVASGFWSAMLFRALSGIGLAGTYMPGLKTLIDRYDGPNQSRAVAFYTSSFSLGTASSFFLAGWIAEVADWRIAFAAAAVAALGALVLVQVLTRPMPVEAPERAAPILDVRPVLRNRAALGFILAYGVHNWELFVFRTWLVPFLVFSLGLQAAGAWALEPTLVATLVALVSMVASVSGNELAVRFGRDRTVSLIMAAGAIFSCVVGFTAPLPYVWVVLCVTFYNVLAIGDSAAITAGTIRWAESGRRGGTLAVHAVVGFACAAAGPPLAGWMLDLSGGGLNTGSWALAFATGGLVALIGPMTIRWTRGARKIPSP